MYVCMMCSSARGLGGFCYTNEINWFGDCDVAPEECPQCGAGLGVVRVDPSEPVAISTLCDIVRQQHGALATLREERARLAEVEAERDAARGIAPDDGRTHTLLLHLTPALLARVEALGYAPGVTPAGVLPWLVDALEEAREEIEVLRSQNTSYWSDLVACREQVEKDRAAILRLTEERDAARAEIEELRLTLAAEQGRPEGAPSEGWRWCDGVWSKDFPHGHHVRIMLAAGAGGSIMHVHHATEPHRRIAADSARAAMIAADKATT